MQRCQACLNTLSWFDRHLIQHNVACGDVTLMALLVLHRPKSLGSAKSSVLPVLLSPKEVHSRSPLVTVWMPTREICRANFEPART